MHLHTHIDIVQESSPLQKCTFPLTTSPKLSRRSRVYFEAKKNDKLFKKVFESIVMYGEVMVEHRVRKDYYAAITTEVNGEVSGEEVSYSEVQKYLKGKNYKT